MFLVLKNIQDQTGCETKIDLSLSAITSNFKWEGNLSKEPIILFTWPLRNKQCVLTLCEGVIAAYHLPRKGVSSSMYGLPCSFRGSEVWRRHSWVSEAEIKVLTTSWLGVFFQTSPGYLHKPAPCSYGTGVSVVLLAVKPEFLCGLRL